MGGLRHAAAALAAAVIWVWAGGAAAAEIATVAKSGDVAPGAGGATFTRFSSPVLNGAGEVAFEGSLSRGGGDSGIWLAGPAGLAPVAVFGDAAPGAGGATFSGFSGPLLNGAGEVAFRVFLGVCCADGGIWVGGPASLALVAKSGDAAPGASGATFGQFENPVLNGAGEVAFVAGLSGGGLGGNGIWRSGPAGLAPVALPGDPAPGAGGATFTNFDDDDRPVLNGAGEVAFLGFLSDGNQGIWRGTPASLALVVKEGDAAPGAGGPTFSRFSAHALNATGEVAFKGFLGVCCADQGIWRSGPAGLAPVAVPGDLAPGAGGQTFTFFGNPVLNGAGEVAFLGDLSGGGVGLWRSGPAGLALVAKSGDVAPGAGGPTFTGFDSPALNGAGEVAFRADLSGGGEGIWAGPSGGLQLVVRDGDDIEVAPGDSRTVSLPRLSGATGNEDGRRSGFSEGGQVAFHAEFTDTSQGIFLSPPETPTVHRVPFRAVDGAWGPVMLPKSFKKPVIVAGPPGSANKQPGAVRLREIEGAEGRFQARFQEWRYLDGKHPEERTDFLALERGRHKQADGSIWEAGILKLKDNANWKRKKFSKRFRGKPMLFLTVQSSKDKAPVAVRARNVTRKGFEAALFEEEKTLGTGHKRERVGYLAVYSKKRKGTVEGGVDGTDYRLKQSNLDHKFKKVLGTKLKLEEERSQDKELRHAKERVSVMTLGRGLFAQQASDKEADTTAIRRR